jgi:hypothetical protein
MRRRAKKYIDAAGGATEYGCDANGSEEDRDSGRLRDHKYDE